MKCECHRWGETSASADLWAAGDDPLLVNVHTLSRSMSAAVTVEPAPLLLQGSPSSGHKVPQVQTRRASLYWDETLPYVLLEKISSRTHLYRGKMVTGKVKDELWRLEHGYLSSVHFNLYESITVLLMLPVEQVWLTWRWFLVEQQMTQMLKSDMSAQSDQRHSGVTGNPFSLALRRFSMRKRGWLNLPEKNRQAQVNICMRKWTRGAVMRKKKGNQVQETVEQYPVNRSACNFSVHPSFIYLFLLPLSCF